MRIAKALRAAVSDPARTFARLAGVVGSFRPRVQATRFCRYDAGGPIPELALADHVSIEVLGPSQIDVLRQTWPIGAKELHRRIHRGDRCYVAVLNGQLVFHAWVQSTGRHVIAPAGRTITIAPDEALVYDGLADAAAYRRAVETLPRRDVEQARRRQRGTGICAPLLARILRDEMDKGTTTVWAYTTLENVASHRCQLRGGLVPAHQLRALALGGLALPIPSRKEPDGPTR